MLADYVRFIRELLPVCERKAAIVAMGYRLKCLHVQENDHANCPAYHRASNLKAPTIIHSINNTTPELRRCDEVQDSFFVPCNNNYYFENHPDLRRTTKVRRD